MGRDARRPGLVVTLLNVHKARDRSHYERFAACHDTFYRGVEATGVTPFSPPALDRGLAGAAVALARLEHAPLTPACGADRIIEERASLEFVSAALRERVTRYADLPAAESQRVQDLLDEWGQIALDYRDDGVSLQYQVEEGGARRLLYEFPHPELRTLARQPWKFRANRSMRDVEASVNLRVRTLDDRAGH